MSVGESIGCVSPTLYLTHASFIDFSNILSKTALERLAQVDEYEVVREVQVGSDPIFTDTISQWNDDLTGVLCRLRAHIAIPFFFESDAVTIKTSIWLNGQFMGSSGP